MKLFIELYLDEDVSVLLAELFRARGYNVTTALEAGMLTKDDPEQLAFAVSKGFCILTHNREHFEELHKYYLDRSLFHYSITPKNFVFLTKIFFKISRKAAKNANKYIVLHFASFAALRENNIWLRLCCVMELLPLRENQFNN